MGTFEDFLRQCSEDVAVLGHTHTWDSCVLTKENEEMIYVNAGTWIDYKEEVATRIAVLSYYFLTFAAERLFILDLSFANPLSFMTL